MTITTIHWKNAEIDVEFNYEGASEGSTDSWGAKYEPDTDESVEIESIMYKGINVVDLFDDEELEVISGEILERIKNEYAWDVD